MSPRTVVRSRMNCRRTYTLITDRYAPFGLRKGEEIDYSPYTGQKCAGLYFLWIRGTKRYIVMRLKASDFTRPVRIGRESFDWEEISLLGTIARRDSILDSPVLYAVKLFIFAVLWNTLQFS